MAKRFDVAKSFVYKIYKRYKDTGSYEALRQPEVKPELTSEDIEKLKILVSENPSATLDELITLGNFSVCRTTIYNTQYTIHNTQYTIHNTQKREDVEIAREKWKQESPNWNIEHVEANEDSE